MTVILTQEPAHTACFAQAQSATLAARSLTARHLGTGWTFEAYAVATPISGQYEWRIEALSRGGDWLGDVARGAC